jgi:oligopeptide transport system substrate-binding protein
VIPDLTESWTISPDGIVYTFKLRKSVTVHNGKPFTAHDVKYSWERACDPQTESYTAATYLGDIQGVDRVISGISKDISGVKILDDFTLEVTLDEPKAYFLHKLSYVTSFIVDRESIDRIEDAPNGTGPFKLVRHNEEEFIILVRNENYYRGKVDLEHVVYLIYQGPSIRMYESGDIDLVYISEDLIERAEDPLDPLYGNVQPITGLCTSYVVYDVTRPPFNDFKVREAFTKAIDKVRINEILAEGKGVIAKGLYPPGLPGYNSEVQPIPFNPDEARASLENSSFGGPDGLPEIVLTVGGGGSDLSRYHALLLQMWNEALGVTIVVEQIDYENYYDEINAGNH